MEIKINVTYLSSISLTHKLTRYGQCKYTCNFRQSVLQGERGHDKGLIMQDTSHGDIPW